MWAYLHLWSLSFPHAPTSAERVRVATTLLGILRTLPCNICVDNVPANLVALGFVAPHTPKRLAASQFMQSRDTFTRFIFDLHNQVSKMLGKDTSPIEYASVMQDLEFARAKACTQKSDQHAGCVQPQYKACKTKIYIMTRDDLHGGSTLEHNFNLSL
jgi:hypothetical protein